MEEYDDYYEEYDDCDCPPDPSTCNHFFGTATGDIEQADGGYGTVWLCDYCGTTTVIFDQQLTDRFT